MDVRDHGRHGGSFRGYIHTRLTVLSAHLGATIAGSDVGCSEGVCRAVEDVLRFAAVMTAARTLLCRLLNARALVYIGKASIVVMEKKGNDNVLRSYFTVVRVGSLIQSE